MSGWLPETAVVTGGASGIGLALARELRARGVRLLLVDLSGDTLRRAAAELDANWYECDVCNEEEVEAMAHCAFDKLGTVDLLLNNAGQGGPSGKPLWEIPYREARAHFDVNFWSVWKCCAELLPRMIESGRQAAVFNTASENSFFCAAPRMAAYIAAKHAVLGLTENLREDLPERVHAGTIVPGWVYTAIGPREFMQHGMDVARYAAIAIPQILARERFVVSHYSNVSRIAERAGALSAAYEKYAPREGGDDAYDVRSTLERLRAG